MRRNSLATLSVFSLMLTGCSGLSDINLQPQKGRLVVNPSSATLRGGDTQPFAATASDGTSPAVAWSVNGIAGGDAVNGMISATGVYTAPEFPPTTNSVKISAAEAADATINSSSAVTVNNPVPMVTTVNPTSIQVGAFNLTVNGLHFATGAKIMFGTTALTTTRVSSTQVTASSTATSGQVGNVAVTVQNPNPGLVSSSAITAQVVTSSPITVAVSPASASVRAGSNQNFSATVSGSTNQAVTWSIAGHAGGDATVGYMTSQGVYQAPATLPTPNNISVVATSAADASKTANSAVTLQNAVPVLTSISPSSIGVGAFMLNISGSGFANGATVNFGGQVLTTMYLSPTQLTATGTATAGQTGSVAVTVTNPDPGTATSSSVMAQVVNGGPVVSASAAVRFLEQSTFGPTPALVNQVQQTGFDTFLQGQMSAATSAYPAPAATDTNISNLQTVFFKNAVLDNDQLRQRMALALNEIWVVGQNKVSDPTGYTDYIQVLNNDALGNYRTLMKDVTLTPAMGHWLDMVNNDKPGTGQHANENYSREIMQLFTLGLDQLNQDGTPVVDGSGMPVAAYSEMDVEQLGRSFTGWTYPTMAGMTLQKHNPDYYGSPTNSIQANFMVPYESNHDSSAKMLMGQNVAAGQSAEQELDNTLNIIFSQTSLPPFICQQLIEKLVTSNPSPGYVSRVTQAFVSGKFNTYGSGQRGDLQAVAAAILLDAEARRGDSPTTTVAGDGKLREPIVMEASIAREFNATTDGSGFTGQSGNMAENIFNSPSVFNFFPPQSLIPQTSINGPEFAIFNTNTSLSRVNFINSIVFGQISGNTKLNLSAVAQAGTPDQMVAMLNTQMLHGTMSDSMKQSILTAIASIPVATPPSANDLTNQAKAAIYLVASSSQYQVQR